MTYMDQVPSTDNITGGKFHLYVLLSIILCLTIDIRAQTEWIKHPCNPVLESGIQGSWDSNYLLEPWVLFDGYTYEMWYVGNDGNFSRIGYAISNDGVNWTKVDSVNPVLSQGPSGSWEDDNMGEPAVIFDGTTYKMWYRGYDGSITRIGYATSDDGLHWTKVDSVNPVLDIGPPGAWDDAGVGVPVVILVDSTYMLWYSGRDGTNRRIGLATSPDGIHWTKYEGNPVMDIGTGWDGIGVAPEVVHIRSNPDVFWMWYAGFDKNSVVRTGFATSPDGISWTKDSLNPVLDIGSAGEWDAGTAAAGAGFWVGERSLLMYYDSFDGSDGSVGLAVNDYYSIDSCTVGIEEGPFDQPYSYVLHPAYPNPFNPVSTIRYELPKASDVSLIVYDILGREVARLVDGYAEPGYHEVTWDAGNFASSIYIARLVTPEYSKSIKMVLLK